MFDLHTVTHLIMDLTQPVCIALHKLSTIVSYSTQLQYLSAKPCFDKYKITFLPTKDTLPLKDVLHSIHTCMLHDHS